MLVLYAALTGLASAAEVPPNAGDRAKELASAFVARHGPRPTNTRTGARAQDWVAEALTARGWQAQDLGTYPGAVLACQAGELDRSLVLLAHTDTVPGSPGGNDNAAGVGVLLTTAELLRGVQTPRTVCLAFPDAEETGLRGSRALAEAFDRGQLPGPVDQAVSLDLVGVGEPTWVGLGPQWGHRRLTALLTHAPAAVPWVHRGIAHGWPHMERSDHHWFAQRQIPASQLYARGVGGVDWAYHTPLDTASRLEPATLQNAVEGMVGLGLAPPLPVEDGGPAPVVPFTHLALPAWTTGLAFVLGGLGWLAGLGGPWPDRREVAAGAVGWLAHGLVAAAAFGMAVFFALGFRRLELALAGPALCAGWAAWGAVAAGAPFETPAVVGRALGGAVALGLAAFLVVQGLPLVAVPLALAAAGVGLSRFSVLPIALAWWPALFVVRPNTVRELAFHHLFPGHPAWWTVVAGVVLLIPLGTLDPERIRHRERVAALLLVAMLVAWVGAWLTPEQMPPFVDWSAMTR